MRVAVVTPYYTEPEETLRECIASVAKQTYKDVHHFMVSDGEPFEGLDGFTRLTHIRLPNAGDFGDTPRGIGAAVASSLGYDAICFLDADCWYEPDHVEYMVGVLKESGTEIVTCPRNLFRENGTFMCVDKESDGYAFNDTNCYLFTKPTFHLLRNWLFKSQADCALGDRHMWAHVKNHNPRIARSLKPTVNYSTRVTQHYKDFGEQPPKDSQIIFQTQDSVDIYKLARTIPR